jgi:hypothetical protein
MPPCKDDAQVHAVVRIMAATWPDPRRGLWQGQPITCAPTHGHCARTQHTHGDTHPHVTRNPSIHAHHATEERAQTRANKWACSSSPEAQVHYYHIIVVLWWYYYLRLWPRAGPHALIFCGRAPYARVKHAAGNHSSSTRSSRRQQDRPVFLNTNLNAKRKGRTRDAG